VKLHNIIAIAVALAMDAFAVAIATGIRLKIVNIRQTFRLSWHFGFFQALMPIVGWYSGLTVRPFIEQYDHWLAFALLSFVGSKMIIEAFRKNDNENRKIDPTKGYTLIMLSVATSIDALAVGLSIAMLKINIWLPAFVIGVVAMLFTVIGLHLNKIVEVPTRLSQYAETIGGIVLLGIGFNILREHTAFTLFS